MFEVYLLMIGEIKVSTYFQ